MTSVQSDVQYSENWFLVTPGSKSSIRITQGLTFQADEQGQLVLDSADSEDRLIRFEVNDGDVWLSLCDPDWQLLSGRNPVDLPVRLNQATSLRLLDSIVHLRTDFSKITDRDVLDLTLEQKPDSEPDVREPAPFTFWLVEDSPSEQRPDDTIVDDPNGTEGSSEPFDDSIPTLVDVIVENPGPKAEFPHWPTLGTTQVPTSFLTIDTQEIVFPELEIEPQSGQFAEASAFVPTRPTYLRKQTPSKPGAHRRLQTSISVLIFLAGLLLSPALLETEPALDVRPAVAHRQPKATTPTKELLVAVEALMEGPSPMDPVTLQFVVDAYRASNAELSEDLQRQQQLQQLDPD